MAVELLIIHGVSIDIYFLFSVMSKRSELLPTSFDVATAIPRQLFLSTAQ